jgi:hypothetical protein
MSLPWRLRVSTMSHNSNPIDIASQRLHVFRFTRPMLAWASHHWITMWYLCMLVAQKHKRKPCFFSCSCALVLLVNLCLWTKFYGHALKKAALLVTYYGKIVCVWFLLSLRLHKRNMVALGMLVVLPGFFLSWALSSSMFLFSVDVWSFQKNW